MKHLLTLAVTSLLATTAFADPIHSAVWNGDLEGVQAELDNGVDVDEKDDLWGRTPLHIAAEEGHKEIAELLIAKGASVNAQNVGGLTPLDFAIIGKQPETADLLRKHGGKMSRELKAEGK
jgi:ankyrin repeat protein